MRKTIGVGLAIAVLLTLMALPAAAGDYYYKHKDAYPPDVTIVVPDKIVKKVVKVEAVVPAKLPRTGADPGAALGVAFGLLALGGTALGVARRRSGAALSA